MGIDILSPDHASCVWSAVADCSTHPRWKIAKQSPNGADVRADAFLTQAVHEIFFHGVGEE